MHPPWWRDAELGGNEGIVNIEVGEVDGGGRDLRRSAPKVLDSAKTCAKTSDNTPIGSSGASPRQCA